MKRMAQSSIAEATAALEADCNAVLVERPGNKPLSDEDKETFPTVEAFDDIVFK